MSNKIEDCSYKGGYGIYTLRQLSYKQLQAISKIMLFNIYRHATNITIYGNTFSAAIFRYQLVSFIMPYTEDFSMCWLLQIGHLLCYNNSQSNHSTG